MTRYLSPSFSVAAPTGKAYADNYDATFGAGLKPGACPNCEGRGRNGCVECLSCEGTGRAAYMPKLDAPVFDNSDEG
jgi:DnaJ-class molecular chaperone